MLFSLPTYLYNCGWLVGMVVSRYVVSKTLMYRSSTYLVVTYFPTSLPIYRTHILQNGLLRWNQILTKLKFIHNWVINGIQWMVHGVGLLVHSCFCCTYFSTLHAKFCKHRGFNNLPSCQSHSHCTPSDPWYHWFCFQWQACAVFLHDSPFYNCFHLLYCHICLTVSTLQHT